MRIDAPLFSLECTLNCGQVFGWRKCNAYYQGTIGNNAVRIRQLGEKLVFEGTSNKAIARYFRFDDDLQKIYAAIGKDKVMREAIKKHKGLRLVRQEPWECAVSYICSANANIPRIEKMLFNLRKKFGKPLAFGLYSFPEPKAIANASLAELKKCGLGFRAKYVKKFANNVNSGKIDLDLLKAKDYHDAKKLLLAQKGIGEKIADCILLFSCDKLRAFPIDVWIRRAMTKLYGKKIKKYSRSKKISDDAIRRFASDYFGDYAGYAQEYIYANARGRKI